MGDPRKQRKIYSGPSHPWQKARIDTEAALKKKYGYKNKKELWKFTSKLRNYRSQARSLIPKIDTAQGKIELGQLMNKLQSYGLVSEKPTIDEVLQLNIEDLLERRLQTIVFRRGFSNTMGQARQFIVHGHIRIDGQKITSPSYMVKKTEEKEIAINEEITKKLKRKELNKIKKEVEKIKQDEKQTEGNTEVGSTASRE